jgi:hypothetical protein
MNKPRIKKMVLMPSELNCSRISFIFFYKGREEGDEIEFKIRAHSCVS